jgi:hypothetical protein
VGVGVVAVVVHRVFYQQSKVLGKNCVELEVFFSVSAAALLLLFQRTLTFVALGDIGLCPCSKGIIALSTLPKVDI